MSNSKRAGASRVRNEHGTEALGKGVRWVVPGSRLLQNHRAAILESGSPPGLGQLVRAERLQTYRVHFSPFRSLGFSGFPRPRIRPCGVMEYCATANCARVAGRDAEATE